MEGKTKRRWWQLSMLGGFIVVVVWFFFTNRTSYLPKPYGYNHIVLPVAAYRMLPDTFPYCFEFSKYAVVVPHTSPSTEPYWIDLHYPSFGANIQLTYKQIKNDKELLKSYLEDSYLLTAKHQIRAYEINEERMETPNGLQAVLVSINGQVPTPYQFYTTDSANHFLRGALYFNTALANDSLAPIIDFIKQDIHHMLYTLQWKKPTTVCRRQWVEAIQPVSK